MSFGGDSASFDILVNATDLDQLGSKLGSSVAKGVSTAKKEVAGLDRAVAQASKAVNQSGVAFGRNLSKGIATGLRTNSASVQAALIQQITQATRGTQQAASAQARQVLAAQNAAARQQLAQTTAVGHQQAAIAQSVGQQAVIAARTSGAQRVAITRAFLDTIGRLEKGLGRIIEGTASTIVSATRRIFAGTVGSIQRSFAQRHEVITRNLRIENGLFASSAAVQQRASRGLLGFGLGAAGLIGGGALVATAIRQTFTLGSQFASGLNVLQAQLHLTADQMKEVSKLSITLGNDVKLPGVSALDAAQAIGLLGKQFATSGDQAIVFAEQAAKGTLQLSRATGATAEQAAAAVGSAVNAFGVSATDAGKVADSFAGAVARAGGADFQNFTDALSQGAAVFSQFQVPAVGSIQAVNEFNAAIATLSKGGLAGGDAGAALKQFFLQANRSAPAAQKALQGVADKAGVLGGVFFDQQNNARDLTSIINILNAGLTGLSDAERTATLQTIFGSRGIAAANILLKEGGAAFLTTVANLNTEGRAAELAAAKNKGLAGALDAIKSQFETFAILIFQKVNKPLGNAGLAVANFIDKLANAGGIFAAVRAGLKGIGIALGALVAIKGLAEIVGFAKALVGALGPLGIVAIILGGAIGFLLKRFGSLQGVLDAVGRLVDRIAPQVATLRGIIFDFLSGLARRADFLGRFSGFLSQIFDLLGQGKAAQAFDRLKVAAGALLQNLKPIGDAVKSLIIPFRNLLAGDFAAAFSGFQHVAGQIASTINDQLQKAFSALNPFSKIGLDFVSKFKAQFIGGGIGAVAGGLIAGPIGIALGAALGVAVANAIGKLRDIIGRVDVGALFGKFLDGVQEVGRRLGSFLSDQRFLLAVAGVAAAAAAIAARFIQGFVTGILGHAGDIAAAIGKVFQAAFQLPSIVKSIVAFGILVRGLLTDQFKNLTFGDALKKQIEGQLQKSVDAATLGDKLKAGFALTGKKLGQALTVGIASALSGSALGSASSNLEKGLGVAGIAGSAAAAFSSFGGGPQGAIAATATVGIGLLTAALTANAKKAAEAKAAMTDYKVALDQAAESGKTVADAINGIFGANVKKATDDQLKAIQALGINLNDFQDALAAGKGPEFLKTFTDRFKELQTIQARGAQAGGSFLTSQQSADLKNLQTGLPFLAKQINAVNDAGKRRDLEGSLRAGATAADRFEQRVSGVSGSAGRLTKEIEASKAAAQKLFQEQRAEKLKAELDTVKQKAVDIGTKADEANKKLIALLTPKVPAATGQQAADQAAIATPGFATDIAGGLEKGVGTALGGAQVRQGVQDFGTQVLAPLFGVALKEGIKNGDPAGALSAALLNETIAINQLEVPQAAKDQLLSALNASFQTASNPVNIPVGAEANLLEAQKAAADLHATAVAEAQAKGQIVLTSGADLVSAQKAGSDSAGTAGVAADKIPMNLRSQANVASATGAGNTIHGTAQKAADKPIKVGSTVTAGTGGNAAGNAVARSVLDGFSAGMASGSRAVTKTVTSVFAGVTATAAATFQIHSPSKVFMGIGEDVMKGLEEGIRSGGAAVLSAVGAVASAMIDSTRNAANSVPSALKTLFDDSFDALAIGGGGRTSKAVEGLTSAMRSVITQVRSNAETLFGAASKPEGERTLAERLLLGESFTSLRAGDEFGVANRGAIAGAVDAIKAIGEALLEQGFSAQSAADQMLNYRSQLLLTAVQAGLSAAEVDGLINSLGLSVTGLTGFVSQADKLNQIIAEGQRRAAVPNTPPPLTTGPNPTSAFITNNIFLPTGDPEANALAIVNRQALAVR